MSTTSLPLVLFSSVQRYRPRNWACSALDRNSVTETRTIVSGSGHSIGMLAQPGYRKRAQQLSLEFASHDVATELLSLIEECIPMTVDA